jgi:hypothetical protein
MPPRATGGGAATAAGISYQSRVAAWIAVQILAEQDVSPPWALPETVTLEALHAEAPGPIDDLVINTSVRGEGFTQSKHRLDLGTAPGSDFGNTVKQFVRQYCGAPHNHLILTKTDLFS